MSASPVIEVGQLSVGYGDFPAVRHVSSQAERGGFYALLGMGDRARQVPLLVIQGERDEVVPPLVATRLVDHWTSVADLVDDGLLNDSLGVAEETTTAPSSPDRHAYTHTTIIAPDGTSVVESYLVRDMGHAWPGPAADGLFTDRGGPDASAIVWDFAMRHPKP